MKMSSTSKDLELKKLMGEDLFSLATSEAVNGLLKAFENFEEGTTVKGTGNIFDCAVTIGDFDFEMDLDFFKMRETKPDLILLEKIKYLRRLISDINNIFISIIQDLECCTGDDRYNKTVVPIFKWLVEDQNGLCGTLLRISKEINKVYLPLKRVLCLFRNIPGNPTIGSLGTDYLSWVYPITDGLEKVMNMIDNGKFLDIIIVPVKNFHDKLIACSNGQDSDFYSGYSSISDLLSASIYDELTTSLIDELKRSKNETVDVKNDAPVAPTPPGVTYDAHVPSISEFENYDEFKKAMYVYNIGYNKARQTAEREYNNAYSNYMTELTKYRNKKFQKTMELKDETFENTNFTVSMLADDFKKKHRAICGCLGEIFRMDGFFVPKESIIRTQSDLDALVGEVKYKGINAENYYFEKDGQQRIEILNQYNIPDLLKDEINTSFMEVMKYPIVKDIYTEKMATLVNVKDVITQNAEWKKEINQKNIEFNKLANYYDTLADAFYEMYLSEVQEARLAIARYQAGLVDDKATSSEASQKLAMLSEFPPADWIVNDKSLSEKFQRNFGQITYKQYMEGIGKLAKLNAEIDDLKNAIGRNHTVIKLVDNSEIECGCDLLCMVIQYLIKMIMNVIKSLIGFIIKYLTQSTMNKELQWWIKFITEKIKCILDILKLKDDLKYMEEQFDREIFAAKGSIRKAPESIANCSDNIVSVVDELNLYEEKAKVQPDDIPWVPSQYPEFEEQVDVTPTVDKPFNLITKEVTFEPSEWKNRTIPTAILDCSKDHHMEVDWKPSGNTWSAYLNIVLDYDKFINAPDLVLKGNLAKTEADIINEAYIDILYKLLAGALSQTDFEYKVKYKTIEIEMNTRTCPMEGCSISYEKLVVGAKNLDLIDISEVYFKFDDEWIKVYDRNAVTNYNTFLATTQNTIAKSLKEFKKVEPDYSNVSNTSSKVCSASNLKITVFEPLYNDPALSIYPGKLTRNVAVNGDVSFTYQPKTTIDVNGVVSTFVHRNVPFKLTLTNGSGTNITVIMLLDVCPPENVLSLGYDVNTDGVFEFNRYDYIEFGAIPNDADWYITEKSIISKMRGYLEEVGAVSSLTPGILGANTTTENTLETVDNTINSPKYDSSFDASADISGLANETIANLPDGTMKNTILKYQALIQMYETTLDDIKDTVNIVENYSLLNTDLQMQPTLSTGIDSRLGIPLMTLNEAENIILTIHQKKLKVINLNSNINISSVLETTEIDYQEGENLFIEFSTNGFVHTISWINERKVKVSATMMAMNSLALAPTQIGSFYKNGIKVALMCGKVEDVIFTNTNREPEEWFNNSNTFRPKGTIGYYDFSMFDGYHVYAVPEFFKVVVLSDLATAKGILYESNTLSRQEIAQKIQDNNLNDLLATKVTIVGEKPIVVGGDFVWKNKVYYKNVTFGYLDNFFCRDNLSGNSFTISFWLKQKDSVTNNRENFMKKYIFSDTHNGNFIWIEDDQIHLQFRNQLLVKEPITLLFKKNIYSTEPEYIEKWFNHVFRYDITRGKVFYTIEAIDQKRNFDNSYDPLILDKTNIEITLLPSKNTSRDLKFSLVTMLARYDVKKLDYTDYFHAEVAALAIWNSFKSNDYMKSIYNYQRKIITAEM